jgi:hypothetical protein
MLHEYFSIRVSENGELLSIPMLIKNYVPTLDKLPLFLLRLGTEVCLQVQRLNPRHDVNLVDRWTGMARRNVLKH